MSSVQLQDFDADQLAKFRENIVAEFNELKSKNLKLDLTRGKPSSEQLDFADELLALPGKGEFIAADGTDVRNYGGLTGITDIRQLWADLMGIDVAQIIAGDSSSLNLMFDVISWSYIFGNNDSERPWKDEETIKWICPVPGYDRHFSITERFGFEMISVPMNEDGPDVAAITELVKDPQVKGMWVVPTFSNPTGYSVSADVAKQLAELETAA
ncbi:MAG: aminotransferase, partial [Corynebacterium sp.]|nr:aminotransferase [Corynebacterium sp.]